MTQLDTRTGVSPGGAPRDHAPVQSRWLRVRSLVVGGVVVTGLTVAVHFRDPHQHGSWGLCPLFALTGIYCPGCGGMRAANDLTDGNLRAAVSSNLLVLTLLPAVVLWWLTRLRDQWRGTDVVPLARQHATTITYVIGAIAILFAIVRNTPWGAALAP